MMKEKVQYTTPANETEKHMLENKHFWRYYGLGALEGSYKLLNKLLLPWEEFDLDNFDIAEDVISVCHHDIVAEYQILNHCCYLTDYIFRSRKYALSFIPKELVRLHQTLQANNLLHVEFPELYGNVVCRTNHAKKCLESKEVFQNAVELEKVYHAFIKGNNPSLLVNATENVFTVRNRLEKGKVLHIIKSGDILQIYGKEMEAKYRIAPEEGVLYLA